MAAVPRLGEDIRRTGIKMEITRIEIFRMEVIKMKIKLRKDTRRAITGMEVIIRKLHIRMNTSVKRIWTLRNCWMNMA